MFTYIIAGYSFEQRHYLSSSQRIIHTMKSLSFRKKKSHPVVDQGFSYGAILCFLSACSSQLLQISSAWGKSPKVRWVTPPALLAALEIQQQSHYELKANAFPPVITDKFPEVWFDCQGIVCWVSNRCEVMKFLHGSLLDLHHFRRPFPNRNIGFNI